MIPSVSNCLVPKIQLLPLENRSECPNAEKRVEILARMALAPLEKQGFDEGFEAHFKKFYLFQRNNLSHLRLSVAKDPKYLLLAFEIYFDITPKCREVCQEFLLENMTHLMRIVEKAPIKEIFERICKEEKDPFLIAIQGFFYEMGWSVAKDEKKALKLYQKACEKSSKAALFLQSHFAFNHGDLEKAFQFIQEALNLYPEFSLGHHLLAMIEKSRGNLLAHEKALSNAADFKSPSALYTLALNKSQCKKEQSKALYYLEESARQGHSKANFVLGEWFWHGFLVEKNREKSCSFFQRAMECGEVEAAHYLGRAFLEGQGVERNLPLAKQIFGLGAELGNAQAMTQLAKMYLLGLGGNREVNKGVVLLEQAHALGFPSAAYLLGSLYESGTGKNQDKDKALDLYKEAADAGDMTALIRAAFLLAAKETEEGDSEALCYFERAAARGVPQAIEWARYLNEKKGKSMPSPCVIQ